MKNVYRTLIARTTLFSHPFQRSSLSSINTKKERQLIGYLRLMSEHAAAVHGDAVAQQETCCSHSSNEVGIVLSLGFLNVHIPKPSSTSSDYDTEEHTQKRKVNIESYNVVSEKDVSSNDKLDSSTLTEDRNVIPETVLQYERQYRKNQAAKRASAPLSKSQLNIIHNDENIVVASKPSGVLTVPGINSNPSLLSLIHEKYNKDIEDEMKMDHMIIHRLDMDTSGLLVFAKDKQSMSFLQKAFRERNVEKEYEALVCGHLSNDVNDGCIDLPLQRDHHFPPFMRAATPESEKQAQRVVKDLNHAGWKKIIKKKAKPSKTLFRVMSREFVKDAHDPSKLLPVTRLHLTPVTGRTHQLRVHCAAIGHPILGDPAYGIMGEASPFGGFEYKSIANIMPSMAKNRLQLELDKYVKESKQCMCLHARKLKLNHPISGQEMQFQEPPKF